MPLIAPKVCDLEKREAKMPLIAPKVCDLEEREAKMPLIAPKSAELSLDNFHWPGAISLRA
ncbi:hypothetical protein BSK67_08785 [Paenibacillus odorifer]|nr:hypothetical protein BSK67_08785 [Paenibacillus odorifer]